MKRTSRTAAAATAALTSLSLPLSAFTLLSTALLSTALVSVALVSTAGCGGGAGQSTVAPSTEPARYVVTEIVSLPYRAVFVDRNRDGYLVGSKALGIQYDDGLVVSPDGTVTVIPNPAGGFTVTYVEAINNVGQVVGTSIGPNDIGATGFVYDIRSGQTTAIPGLTSPRAINDAGKVVGTDLRGNIRKGMVYDIATGTSEELPRTTTDIHNSVPGNFEPFGITGGGLVAGVLFRDLALYDVNTKALKRVSPTPDTDRSFSSVSGVTESGKVPGNDRRGSGSGLTFRRYIYDIASGRKSYLPDEPQTGGLRTVINEAGAVVLGSSGDLSVYQNGQLKKVSEGLSAEDLAKWQIEDAFAIDESGVIYATAAE
ncbi:MAG: hypothetical protein V4671_30215, partial [Armatimonadota bacterium]